jgi:hypothetical protein
MQCGILGVHRSVPYDAHQELRMLKVPMDVGPEPFAFAPLLIIMLAALVAMVAVLLVMRFLRKGDK